MNQNERQETINYIQGQIDEETFSLEIHQEKYNEMVANFNMTNLLCHPPGVLGAIFHRAWRLLRRYAPTKNTKRCVMLNPLQEASSATSTWNKGHIPCPIPASQWRSEASP